MTVFAPPAPLADLEEVLVRAIADDAEQRPPTKTNELLIIFESGDLERTWGTLILATSAAASGMNVSIFLTFWGFYPLVKPGVRIMGPWMAKRLARSHGVASPSELLEIAQAMGVHLIPCQMTMDMFGLSRDDLIEGLDEPAGAATVLEKIATGVPALFI
jgi:peroxiredoxin family protein